MILDKFVLLLNLPSRDGRSSKDTANTVTVVSRSISRDTDVTLITPDGTPRVLNNESFTSSAAVITDSQDTMIKLSTTESLDYTLSVELEEKTVSFNSNSNGLLLKSSLQLVRGLSSDILEAAVNLSGLGLVKSALSVSSLIGIVFFSFDTSSLSSVSESINHPTTTAALVSGRAINDVLFRKGSQLVSVNEV